MRLCFALKTEGVLKIIYCCLATILAFHLSKAQVVMIRKAKVGWFFFFESTVCTYCLRWEFLRAPALQNWYPKINCIILLFSDAMLYIKTADVCSDHPLLHMYSLHLPLQSPASTQWIHFFQAGMLPCVTAGTETHLCSQHVINSCHCFNLTVIWSSWKGMWAFRKRYRRKLRNYKSTSCKKEAMATPIYIKMNFNWCVY